MLWKILLITILILSSCNTNNIEIENDYTKSINIIDTIISRERRNIYDVVTLNYIDSLKFHGVDDSITMFNYFQLKGKYFYKIAKYEESLEYYNYALNLGINFKEKPYYQLANLNYQKSQIYYKVDGLSMVEKLNHNALKYLDKNPDGVLKLYILVKLLIVSREMHMLKEVDSYVQNIDKVLLSENVNRQITNMVYNSVGRTYLNLGEYCKAVNYFEKVVLSDSFKKKSPLNYSIRLANKAYSRLMIGDTTNVFTDLNTALRLKIETNHNAGKTLVYTYLSEYYKQKGDNSIAYNYLLKALTIADSTNNRIGKIRSLTELMKYNTDSSSNYAHRYIELSKIQNIKNRIARGKYAEIELKTMQYKSKAEKF